jgi:hypothetical protein
MPRASSLSAMARSVGPLGTRDGSAVAIRTVDASPFMPRPYRGIENLDIDSRSTALPMAADTWTLDPGGPRQVTGSIRACVIVDEVVV